MYLKKQAHLRTDKRHNNIILPDTFIEFPGNKANSRKDKTIKVLLFCVGYSNNFHLVQEIFKSSIKDMNICP